MRLSEREVSDRDEILKILSSEKIWHIGFIDNVISYVIAVYYGYKVNAVSVHCAKEG